MLVLAIDPGETSGYVLASAPPLKVLEAGTFSWEDRFKAIVRLTWQAAEWGPVDHVIVETFRLFPHKAVAQIGSNFPSAKLIGAVEALRWLSAASPPILQEPSLKARVAVLEEHRGAWSEYSAADSRHIEDAYKHLRYWLIRQGMDV